MLVSLVLTFEQMNWLASVEMGGSVLMRTLVVMENLELTTCDPHQAIHLGTDNSCPVTSSFNALNCSCTITNINVQL